MYSRQIDGNILTLASSSFTYDKIFVLVDYETQSLWYHMAPGLVCISGHYQDRILPEIPHEQTTWAQWRDGHPETWFFDARASARYEPSVDNP